MAPALRFRPDALRLSIAVADEHAERVGTVSCRKPIMVWLPKIGHTGRDWGNVGGS